MRRWAAALAIIMRVGMKTSEVVERTFSGTQFVSFTITKVQILTQKVEAVYVRIRGPRGC
jgi:DNA-binding MltR family transcriptional regulator